MRQSRLTGLSFLAAALAAAFAFAQPAAQPQSSAVQGVTVKVTPRNVSGDGKPWVFDQDSDQTPGVCRIPGETQGRG